MAAKSILIPLWEREGSIRLYEVKIRAGYADKCFRILANGWILVIRLTRLNDRPFAVNSDLIKFVENAPDTVITLTNGEKVVVKESVDAVIERVIAFKRNLLSDLKRNSSTGPDELAERG